MKSSDEQTPNYLPVTAQVVSVAELTMRQRRCLISIIAAYSPDEEFSHELVSQLAHVFGFHADELHIFLPLIGSGIDPEPFLVDLNVPDMVARGRLLLIILHHSVVRLASLDARARVIIRHIAKKLGISWCWYINEETAYIALLHDGLQEASTSSAPNSQSRRRSKQWLKVGAAAVFGTSLLVFTGGLAAPGIGAGIGALGLTSAGTFIGTTTGTAIVTGLFGATGGSLVGYRMNNLVGDVTEFEFVSMCGETSMQVTICVPGLIDEDIELTDTWSSLKQSVLAPYSQCFVLKWETSALLNVSKGVAGVAAYTVTSAVLQETFKQTLLQGLLNALAWPTTLLSVAAVIDNPWGVAISRADHAGELLAHALLSRAHGNRPVSLVGFSVGARVIVQALLHLDKAKENGLGIVQDAFIAGAPISADTSTWERCRRVTAGRLVNAYSNTDWVLKFCFRTASVNFRVAGLSEVTTSGVENVNLSSIITGHQAYLYNLDSVLEMMHFNFT